MGLSSLFGRGARGSRGEVSAQVRAAAGLSKGERVLATARDERTGDLLLATSQRVLDVDDHDLDAVQVRLARPWHEVDAGSWEPQTATISVTWVNGGRAAQWSLVGGGVEFSEAFYERVAASVLLDAPLDIPDGDGERRVGRVALRRHAATGDIVQQIVWARGAPRTDPALQEYADQVLAALSEQVGLT